MSSQIEPRVFIVGRIANTAVTIGKKLTTGKLNAILKAFDIKPSGRKSPQDADYAYPDKLIKKAYDDIKELKPDTAKHIKDTFVKKDGVTPVIKEPIDLSLLDE